MKSNVIAIDPGRNGGIAWKDDDGIVQACKLFETPRLQAEWIRKVLFESGVNNSRFVVERVGASMPGNAARVITTFARHCGVIDGIIATLGFEPSTVPPKTWMRQIGIEAGLDKKVRKDEIKRLMQERYPHLRVTLATADALGIYTWANNPF